MLVVTAADGDERSGCLVGFHTQCSIHPVRYLVAISKANHTFGVACRASHLVLHFLDRDEMAVAHLFGEQTGDEVDKFARCRWHEGPAGVPIIDDCRHWAVVRVLERVDGGDHVGFITEPVEAHARGPLEQLSFQMVRDFEAGHAP